MDNQFDDLSEYDVKGLTHYGNFKSNIYFLKETGVISKDKKILEIGSGEGGLIAYLLGGGYNIRGLEIQECKINKSKELFGKLPLQLIKSEILPFQDNEFDLVLSFDVIEHIPDSMKHLQEVYRVLKPGGYYLLQTPNKFFNAIFETIRWKSFTRWKKHHCSLHSYWDVLNRFGEINFKVQFHDIPVVTDYFKEKIYSHLGKPGLLILKILNPDRFPLPLRTNLYISAQKCQKYQQDSKLISRP